VVFKWAFVLFAVLSLALFTLSKAIAFMNPPRPGRPAPPLLGRVRRALTWTVLVPAALALVLLALTLLRQP
jgi:predicted secreted protein